MLSTWPEEHIYFGGGQIGENCVIFQQVVIGGNSLVDSKNAGAPVIGDNCYIGAGAKIIGNIKIGNNCRIGAGVTITEDVPENSIVAAPRPCIIQKDHILDNRFVAYRDGQEMYWSNGEWKKL